jgi:hypothetical protein
LRVLIVFITSAVFLLSFLFPIGSAQNQSPPQARELTPRQKALLQTVKDMSGSIRSVAKVLREEGIPIEAGLLFTVHGRKKLRAQLDTFPDMQLSKVHSQPLRGLVMASTIKLSEKSRVEGDTVIIAKHVILSGRAPLIKGPHDIHLFALDSIKAANGRETVITIDSSGVGRKEWLESQRAQAKLPFKRKIDATNHVPAMAQDYNGLRGNDGTMGQPGADGENGIDGIQGAAGSCATTKTGGDGTSGSGGSSGGNGLSGTNGSNGTDAKNATITILNANAGPIHVMARGGAGGNGGPGGYGGLGGKGGNGARGGDGAGCNCNAGGIGDGGNGGPGGGGGSGGNGGKGGNGGNGGNGSTITILYSQNYDISQITLDAGAGSAGMGGPGGAARAGGSGGNPGQGGAGGSVPGCGQGRGGSGGIGGNSGAGGNGGEPGLPGLPGANAGSVLYLPALDPTPSGGGEPAGYEPGMTYDTCTEWFWVSFHCEFYNNTLTPKERKFLANHASALGSIASGWQCFETGREYIGCF